MARLWIRTEASPTLGLGHFMRCFAIAEAAHAQGWKVSFILNSASESAQKHMAAIGANWVQVQSRIGSQADGSGLRTLISSHHWLIIDSYSATADYIAAMYDHCRVLVMDDLAKLSHIRAHMVVNAATAAKTLPYGDIAPQVVACLGPRYAPIRAEFSRDYPKSDQAGFIAIMFGGSDPKNLTGQALSHLYHEMFPMIGQRVPIRLIAGPANPHVEALSAQIVGMEQVSLHVAPESVAETLNGAALVVTAAGGSVGEIAAQNLMALVLIVVDNQVMSLKSSPYPVMDARSGLPEDFAQWVATFIMHPEICQETATRAKALVDGQGPLRIVEIMDELSL
jgi:UDP-2,4-diacetamido-2,4,6-trideoxy-beta-L-altropyranose hydrolase